MTLREKVIVSAYTGYLMCDMSEVHKYIEELLGRPVWTHEIAIPEVQAEIQNKAREAFLNICNDKGDKQIGFECKVEVTEKEELVDDDLTFKEERKPVEPSYVGYNSHDSETFYRCPCCKKTFGDWSIYHQKRNGETPHCPTCEVEFDKEWGDKL